MQVGRALDFRLLQGTSVRVIRSDGITLSTTVAADAADAATAVSLANVAGGNLLATASDDQTFTLEVTVEAVPGEDYAAWTRVLSGNFENGSFVGAVLRDVDLTNSKVGGADFSGCDLRGTNLSDVQNLSATGNTWSQALLDSTTRFPDTWSSTEVRELFDAYGAIGSFQQVSAPADVGAGASIQITVADGAITAAAVVDKGAGYTNPQVVVSVSSGGGSGARLVANVNTAGEIVSCDVVAGGTDYDAATITVDIEDRREDIVTLDHVDLRKHPHAQRRNADIYAHLSAQPTPFFFDSATDLSALPRNALVPVGAVQSVRPRLAVLGHTRDLSIVDVAAAVDADGNTRAVRTARVLRVPPETDFVATTVVPAVIAATTEATAFRGVGDVYTRREPILLRGDQTAATAADLLNRQAKRRAAATETVIAEGVDVYLVQHTTTLRWHFAVVDIDSSTGEAQAHHYSHAGEVITPTADGATEHAMYVVAGDDFVFADDVDDVASSLTVRFQTQDADPSGGATVDLTATVPTSIGQRVVAEDTWTVRTEADRSDLRVGDALVSLDDDLNVLTFAAGHPRAGQPVEAGVTVVAGHDVVVELPAHGRLVSLNRGAPRATTRRWGRLDMWDDFSMDTSYVDAARERLRLRIRVGAALVRDGPVTLHLHFWEPYSARNRAQLAPTVAVPVFVTPSPPLLSSQLGSAYSGEVQMTTHGVVLARMLNRSGFGSLRVRETTAAPADSTARGMLPVLLVADAVAADVEDLVAIDLRRATDLSSFDWRDARLTGADLRRYDLPPRTCAARTCAESSSRPSCRRTSSRSWSTRPRASTSTPPYPATQRTCSAPFESTGTRPTSLPRSWSTTSPRPSHRGCGRRSASCPRNTCSAFPCLRQRPT